MRLLSDHDVYGATVRFLRSAGHDIATAAELGLAQAEDDELLSAAQSQNRILLTRDRDFGSLIFVAGRQGGVIYLRMLPANQQLVHSELQAVLTQYSEAELLAAFVVVESGRHRIRRQAP